MSLPSSIADSLRAVSTATLTTVLLKKGIRRSWMHGPKPIAKGYGRMVGGAG
jgi:hypothetical protein